MKEELKRIETLYEVEKVEVQTKLHNFRDKIGKMKEMVKYCNGVSKESETKVRVFEEQIKSLKEGFEELWVENEVNDRYLALFLPLNVMT